MTLFKNSIMAWSCLAVAALALTACSESKDEPGNGGNSGGNTDPNARTVGITTQVELKTRAAHNLVTELGEGREMRLWAKQYDNVDAADHTPNVKATYQGGTWKLSPEVKLSKDQVAFIYAFFPYSDGMGDNPGAVPVDINAQVDYLYSGIAAPASFQNPQGKLTMKHLQSLLTVNVKKEGNAAGVISAIKVEGGKLIATKGTANVGTGKFTATETGTLQAKVDNSVAGTDGTEGTFPAVWVAPFNSKDNADVVKVTLTIDGKEYTAELPEVGMRTGWQYIFNAVLSSNGLVFIADDIQEFSLDVDEADTPVLEGYGKLVFGVSGGVFTFPAFTGDNVFGTILASGGQSAQFKIGGSLDVGSSNSVSVETWNSTGFEIVDFTNIDSIDLSQY